MSNLHSAESNLKSYAKIKRYPDGSFEIMAANRPIFAPDGWEPSEKWEKEPPRAKRGGSDDARAKRRAVAKIRDIAMCNKFSYFVTLTLNAERVERYDIKPVLARMRSWLDNRVRRAGLKYVLIPECHKDGAIHFHGFFNDALPAEDSGTLKIPGEKRPKKPRSAAERTKILQNGGQIVYNLPDWVLGFSTAIPLYGERAAAIAYCCKYITKAQEKIGGRWYYSGGALATPDVSFADCTADELEAAGAYAFDVPAAGLRLAIYRGGMEPETTGDAAALPSGSGEASGAACDDAQEAPHDGERRRSGGIALSNRPSCRSADGMPENGEILREIL